MTQATLRHALITYKSAGVKGQPSSWGDDADGVWPQEHPLLRSLHNHGSRTAEDAGKQRWPVRGMVHDHHKAEAAVGGHLAKKLLQRLKAAGRCADGHCLGNRCHRSFPCDGRFSGLRTTIFILRYVLLGVHKKFFNRFKFIRVQIEKQWNWNEPLAK